MNGGTYSFIEVSASLSGPTGEVDLGYGAATDDEGITIAPAGDKNTMKPGGDGSIMHSLHADRSGQVTVRLLQTSPQNAKLMAMYELQTSNPTLHGKNAIVVRMHNVGDLHTCTFCAFKKRPEVKYGKDGAMLEWTFDAGYIVGQLGTY